MEEIIRNISIWAVPVVFAIVLHEVSHGWVADKLGDNTARFMGRLTLNPIKHVDPVGTILIPLLLLVMNTGFVFGYAKPVPVDFRKLRNPKRDMVWVAAAGPAINLLLAIASAFILHLALQMPDAWVLVAQPLALMAQASIIINLILCFFNLIPIPPLDGGRMAVGLLPGPLAWKLSRVEPYGFFIIIGLLVTGILPKIIGPLIFGSYNFLLSALGGVL